MSVQNLKELVGFGLSCGELVGALQDGFDLSDLGKVLEAAKRVGSLKNARLALAQYLAMSDAEAQELEAYVIADFDIADDKVEAMIEAGLRVVIELHEVAALFIKIPVAAKP